MVWVAGGVGLVTWVRVWEGEGEGVAIHCKWHLRIRIQLGLVEVIVFPAGGL